MKKILIITYYWPPSGGAAVQRWLSFANLLANQNSVHVLTVDEKFATYQLRDDTLLNEIHPGIRVHKTRTSEPFKIFSFLFGKKSIPKPAFANESNPSFVKKITRFIRGNFFIPDPRKGWKPYALRAADQLMQAEKIDCVITAGPPHSTHFIGEALKQQSGVYWIADFHDLWTDVIYYDMLYHLPIVKKIDKKLERRILEAADTVFTVGEKYKEKLLSKSSDLNADKIKVLRIGYDEKLFAEKKVFRQEQFIITYTGTIADYYHPEVFIAALQKTVNAFPEITFRLRFAGILSDNIRNAIFAAGLEEIFEESGYVSHKEAIQLLQTSTVLLLVNPVTRDEEMVIPGKIYEYLAAAKPIINITRKDAETAALIRHCGAGESFSREEQLPLETYLASLVTEWKVKQTLDITGNDSQVLLYSRKKIAATLDQIIENATEPK
ncbi:glycosyltransferase family 4 protein [Flavisolibacter sp. BT320]|nr:glycosyltransferase family 4 protein [Flavisolibacter longurius]